MTERRKPNPFSPKEIEAKWYSYWEENDFFHAEPDERTPYSIVIPPPNVTGALHMGHALNNVIQDVLIRFYRMRGHNACWIPGTDHAGIATQTVVETRMRREEGKTRHDVGREALLERIWLWKEKFGNRIIEQLKRLGCSCDWERTCFTMDSDLSYAVRFVFLELFREGLIYRGKRLINWCPGCRTALSNDELVHKDIQGHLWEIRYPVKGQDDFITVATTRPETMLGDTAVAVHSEDPRYRDLIGKSCILPLMEREIPIIADDILADPEKGTGAVKVTPGHDPNDHECGRRNALPFINILNDDGTLNENTGAYRDLTVADARKKVLADLKKLKLLGKKQAIEHNVSHCYRTYDVVEPYLSNQWFVKMAPLVELARNAVLDEEVVFFPAKRRDDYLRWLDQTPDWCISRQIWWGHRIPIWYCRRCNPDIEMGAHGDPIRIPEDAKPLLPKKPDGQPKKCPECGGGDLVQDPDVLDTWFSSQLWPMSTFGWPKKTAEFAYYYPTDVLVTARDIIALWVARMVMMGMKFRDMKPFSHVFINPTIQDERGDIMSKSRGNGVDPLKLIEGGSDNIKAERPLGDIPADRVEHYPVYGCDAVRYSLMSMLSGQLQDIRLRVNRTKKKDGHYDVEIPLFEEGRRFCNKIWQACHGVIFPKCEEVKIIKKESPHLEDLWLADKLKDTVTRSGELLASYRIGEMCEILYHFFWDDLCSWYLEIVKPRLWEEHGKRSKHYAQTMLIKGLDCFLRLLHPIMPHLTEELWQELRKQMTEAGTEVPQACIVASWPDANTFASHPEAAGITELAREITSAVNNIRAEQKGIREGQKIPRAILSAGDPAQLEALRPLFGGIERLAKVSAIETQTGDEKPEYSAMRIARDIKIYVPLEGLIDLEAEKNRLEKEISKMEEHIKKLETKLENPKYISKAPAKVVQKDKDLLAEQRKRRDNFVAELKNLGKL